MQDFKNCSHLKHLYCWCDLIFVGMCWTLFALKRYIKNMWFNGMFLLFEPIITELKQFSDLKLVWAFQVWAEFICYLSLLYMSGISIFLTTHCLCHLHREQVVRSKWSECIVWERNVRPRSYLDFNISNFCCRANNGPPNKRGEDVLGEVGACISTLDKLWEGQTENSKAQRSQWEDARRGTFLGL